MGRINPYMNRGEALRQSLGACCMCDAFDNVRKIVDVDGRCPIMGRGWGCTLCDLPPHGAVAVLCLNCFDLYMAGERKLLLICTGLPWTDGRTPIGEMQGSYRHDPLKHLQAGG